MVFVACGLNHKTAPIAVREKIALAVTVDNFTLNCIENIYNIHEIAILSTCNRTEFYCHTDDPSALLPQLAELLQCSLDEWIPYAYNHQHQNAVRHLLRVACGLDSMMLGEPQILGQLKRAYLDACQKGTVKSHLHPVFQSVFSAAKRVRTQSGVGNNPISIAYAATQLIQSRFKNLDELNIFIIGSGETAALVAKYLHQQGAKQFMIANRSLEHAQLLAKRFNGLALTITDIPRSLPQADIVISATACPLPFINQHLIAQALAARDHAFMFLLDLSIPRDIEANVAELEQVCLYNIDDLHHIVGEGLDERRASAIHAEQLVDIEIAQFVDWQRSAKANEMITDYRNHMNQLANLELQRAQKKLSANQCPQDVLDELCKRLVNKLSHIPTQGLKHLAIQPDHDPLTLLQTLLNPYLETALP